MSLTLRRFQTILNIDSDVFGYFYRLSFWDITRPDDIVDGIYVKRVKVIETNDPKLLQAKTIYIEQQNLMEIVRYMRLVYESFWTAKQVFYGKGYLIKSFGNVYRIFPEASPFSIYRLFIDIDLESVDVVYVPGFNGGRHVIPLYSTGEVKDVVGRLCFMEIPPYVRFESFIIVDLKGAQIGATYSKALPINLEVISGKLRKKGEIDVAPGVSAPILEFVPGFRRDILSMVEKGAMSVTYFEMQGIPVSTDDVTNLLAGAKFYRGIVDRLLDRLNEVRSYLERIIIRYRHIELERTINIINTIYDDLKKELDIKPLILGKKAEEKR